MSSIYRIAIACATGMVLVGCAKNDQAAKDSAAAAAAMPAPAPAPAPAPPLTLASLAGKWQFKSVPASGTDTTSTNYVLTATADSTWQIKFPSGVTVPMHVSVSGDSLMEKTGTFPSQRRKGVKVMTEGALRMQDGKLVGTTVAHYSHAGADSVLRLSTTGTKMP
ncbi:MAG TPA: hypothetical protein VGO46_15150 [Gemmatimonadaceae bacterium]|nr:hypothetical protein [Gemmatimonadaceae bacterium]